MAVDEELIHRQPRLSLRLHNGVLVWLPLQIEFSAATNNGSFAFYGSVLRARVIGAKHQGFGQIISASVEDHCDPLARD